MNILFATFYRFIMVPLLSFLAFVLSPFHSKLRDGLRARNWGFGRIYPEIQGEQPIYWFHCSSGEIEYAKPVMRELRQQQPDAKIVMTWHSPSLLRLAEKVPEIDFLVPSPWETKTSYRSFIEHFKPIALLVARTDVWPVMLIAAQDAKIPRILFSATLVKKSPRYSGFGSAAFYSWAHSLFSEILGATASDVKNFKDRGYLGKLSLGGDTRYDQVLWKLQNSPPKGPSIDTSPYPTVLLGSCWPEDEAIVLEALLSYGKPLRIIIAPHEPKPKYLSSIEKRLSSYHKTAQRFTQVKTFTNDIMLVDTVGVLPGLYGYADISFIGGSFKGSIHSVMESLAAGTPCFFGPYYQNNREAEEFLSVSYSLKLNAATLVSSPVDIHALLKKLPDKAEATSRQSLIDHVSSKKNCSKIVLQALSR